MKLHLQLFRDIIGYLRWAFSAMLVLMVIVGLTEGLSVTLLLPLLSHVGISYTPGQGFAGTMLSRGLAVISASVGTVGLLAILIGVAAIQAVLYIWLQWWMVRTSRGYQHRRRLQLFRALVHAQWEFVIGRKVGELTSAIVSESERLAQAFHVGLYLISTAIITCIYLVFALMIAWPITLALLGCALLMTFAVLHLYRQSSAVGKTIAPLNAELHSVLGEQIFGIKIVKATTSEDVATVQVDQIITKLERATTLATILPVVVRGLFEFLAFILLAAIFVLGERGFGTAPGNVIVVFALFVRLFPRITTLQGYLHMLNSCLHALDTTDALQRAADAHAEAMSDQSGHLSIPIPTRLKLHHVDVHLAEHKVLNEINLTVPIPGLIGIVGGSGAGKSTLVHTVLGLVRPSAGTITLGMHDLASAPTGAWRRTIGYVPQETILFHTSIRENLMIAKGNATRAEIRLAAERAHAQNFIEALPRGYDTIIGDHGVKLSGGQRQRLGIARALLANPVLLLMDEAMSVLDAESESELLRTIEGLRGDMGILMVTHRLSAVQTADSIYVIENGRVVECGTWTELMSRRSRFFALAAAQDLASARAAPAY
jgi:ATP-binding cassette subfamily C protein